MSCGSGVRRWEGVVTRQKGLQTTQHKRRNTRGSIRYSGGIGTGAKRQPRTTRTTDPLATQPTRNTRHREGRLPHSNTHTHTHERRPPSAERSGTLCSSLPRNSPQLLGPAAVSRLRSSVFVLTKKRRSAEEKTSECGRLGGRVTDGANITDTKEKECETLKKSVHHKERFHTAIHHSRRSRELTDTETEAHRTTNTSNKQR